MSKKAWGDIVNRSHSTVTDATIDLINEAVKLPQVTKISLGIIKPVKGSRRELKFMPIVGGVKIIVRGSGAVQELYAYSSDLMTVEKILREKFNHNR